LQQFNSFFKDVFGSVAHLPSPKCIDAILQIPLPRQAQMARKLFFPTIDDFDLSGDKRRGNLLGMDADRVRNVLEGVSDNAGWPILTTPHEIDDTEYSHRRPNFLSQLTDSQYVEVFNTLTREPVMNMVFPSWSSFQSDCKKHGPFAKHLLVHLVTWFSPGWRIPKTSSAEIHDFQFPSTIVSNVLSKRLPSYELPEDKNMDLNMAAKLLIAELFDHVSRHYAEWTNSSISEYVCALTPTLLHSPALLDLRVP
jgi:hypothetical protein